MITRAPIDIQSLQEFPPRFVPIQGAAPAQNTEILGRGNAPGGFQAGRWLVYQFLLRWTIAAGLPSWFGLYVSQSNPNTMPAVAAHDFAHPSLSICFGTGLLLAQNGLWVPTVGLQNAVTFEVIGALFEPFELSDFYPWAWCPAAAAGDTVDYAMVAVELDRDS